MSIERNVKDLRPYLLVVVGIVAAITVLALWMIVGTSDPKAWAFTLFGALAGGGSAHLYHHATRQQRR